MSLEQKKKESSKAPNLKRAVKTQSGLENPPTSRGKEFLQAQLLDVFNETSRRIAEVPMYDFSKFYRTSP